MESPVFLIGAERSGTSLLQLVLDGHPEICWPHELDFVFDWPERTNGEWPDLVDYWEMLANARAARHARIVIDAGLAFPDLVRSLVAQLARRTHKPVFGATVHRHYDRILRLWPEARFVYLVRDGRDVARAHVELGWAGNVWAAAPAWREAERAWRSVSAFVPREHRIEVRAEDLVADPRRELGRVCEFLGVAYAPEMLDRAVRAAAEMPELRAGERWREQLSARELGWLEREIGPELRARGYPASSVRPAWIPAPRRFALQLGDRAGRLRFRLRRHAARQWLERQVGRRFRLAAAALALRARAIEGAYSK